MNWPKYTWDARLHNYRGPKGRIVPRTSVRKALDDTIDAASVRMTRDSRLLQAGLINLPEWQLRMEKHIKTFHVMSGAAAAGGWAQATPDVWSHVGNIVKKEYGFLYKFAKDIERGLPLDGRFLYRATSYGSKGSATYENIRRRLDKESKRPYRERRHTHSKNPCRDCVKYRNRGWQKPGVLPDIGEDCECEWNCRCSFEREFI